MLRVFVAALFGAGLVGLATLPAGAQDKKEKPKAPPRIATNEPEKLKDDADFATQGEYVGEIVLNRGKQKIGAQVVAKGEGKFAIKVLIGGLPGAGWDGKTAMVAEAQRGEDGAIAVTGKELSGSIVAGKLMLKDGMKIDTSLAKTERTSTTMGAKPPEGAIVLFGKPGDEATPIGLRVNETKLLDMNAYLASLPAPVNLMGHRRRQAWQASPAGAARLAAPTLNHAWAALARAIPWRAWAW